MVDPWLIEPDPAPQGSGAWKAFESWWGNRFGGSEGSGVSRQRSVSDSPDDEVVETVWTSGPLKGMSDTKTLGEVDTSRERIVGYPERNERREGRRGRTGGGAEPRGAYDSGINRIVRDRERQAPQAGPGLPGREALGMDPGEVAFRPRAPMDSTEARYGTESEEVEPRYFAGDERAPRGWGTERIAQMQRRLVDAGLLTGTYAHGSWDQQSEDAYAMLLGYSNRWGLTEQQTLGRLRNSQAKADAAKGTKAERFIEGEYIPGDFRADAYLKPDYDELTQRVKEVFRSVLGREPREGELGAYVAQLAAADREAYEANLAAARAEFEADEVSRERSFLQQDEERERQFVESGGLPGAEGGREIPEMVQPEDQQAVNPIARFRERFEQDYAGSIARNRRIGEAAEGRQSFMQSVLGMDAAIGGR